MLIQSPPVDELLQVRLSDAPWARHWLLALEKSESVFRFDGDRAGVDVLCTTETAKGKNRARLKLWVPREGTLLVFVYKDSQIHFSTDRFAYGALIIKSGDSLAMESATAPMLAYLDSGLHPDHRPLHLRRAFPYTIPR
ncbi:MAG TPA: hypothetical protein PKA37_00410 [Planctomycetota bacterium]|jgi:hypothetical protein|nr:hypothetical protein [Planctomycetota bacterium]